MRGVRHGTRPTLLLSLLLITGSVPAGCAHNPPDDASSPAIAGWKITFAGSGSSPAMVGGVLYVGSADGAIYALDASIGETGGRVFLISSAAMHPGTGRASQGYLYAIDATTGRP